MKQSSTISLTIPEFSIITKVAILSPNAATNQELTDALWGIYKRIDPEAAAALEKDNERTLAAKRTATMTPEEAGAYIEKMNPPSEEAKALYEAVVQVYGTNATFADVLAPATDSN